MIAALVIIILYLAAGGVFALWALATAPMLAIVPWAVLVVIFFWPYFLLKELLSK